MAGGSRTRHGDSEPEYMPMRISFASRLFDWRRACHIGGLAWTAVFLCGFHLHGSGGDPSATAEEIAARLSSRNHSPQPAAPGYRATRVYVLDNSRLHGHAEMIVRVSSEFPERKEFRVLSVSGPEWMRTVLRKIIDAEKPPASAARRAHNRISVQTYNFRYAGFGTLDGNPCHILRITPKFNDSFMLAGLIWVDSRDFAIVRFEGRTNGKISFWCGKPEITQSFRRFGSLWGPDVTHSMSDSLIFGRTELTVTASDYELLSPKQIQLQAQLTVLP